MGCPESAEGVPGAALAPLRRRIAAPSGAHCPSNPATRAFRLGTEPWPSLTDRAWRHVRVCQLECPLPSHPQQPPSKLPWLPSFAPGQPVGGVMCSSNAQKVMGPLLVAKPEAIAFPPLCRASGRPVRGFVRHEPSPLRVFGWSTPSKCCANRRGCIPALRCWEHPKGPGHALNPRRPQDGGAGQPASLAFAHSLAPMLSSTTCGPSCVSLPWPARIPPSW